MIVLVITDLFILSIDSSGVYNFPPLNIHLVKTADRQKMSFHRVGITQKPGVCKSFFNKDIKCLSSHSLQHEMEKNIGYTAV